MEFNWKIPEGATDWECDWASSERFRLRYFKALSMTEKVKAVEDMCRIADLLKAKRRAASTSDSSARR